MSLDVYLTLEGVSTADLGSGIFVREGGQTKEISRQEGDEKFPGREPVLIATEQNEGEVFNYNITHNLGDMAREANLYTYLWRPEELNLSKVGQLIDPLHSGLKLLKDDPDHFKTFNPSNGWGDYEGLVLFVEKYHTACVIYPNANIRVWK